MTATIQTLDTPDGAFTLLVDERQRVLASGWTADPAAVLGRLRTPPAGVREGSADAAAAVTAYYAGDLGAIDAVEVHPLHRILELDLALGVAPGHEVRTQYLVTGRA